MLPLAQSVFAMRRTKNRISQDPKFPNPSKASARVPLPGLGRENQKCQLHMTWTGLPKVSPFILPPARCTPSPAARTPPPTPAPDCSGRQPQGPHSVNTSPSSKQLPGLAGVGRHVLGSTHRPTSLGVMAAWRRLMALRNPELLLFLI